MVKKGNVYFYEKKPLDQLSPTLPYPKFNSTTHIGRLGTTAAYLILDYCEFLCINSTYLQLAVWEYTTVFVPLLSNTR